jgi:hypothetical protein
VQSLETKHWTQLLAGMSHNGREGVEQSLLAKHSAQRPDDTLQTSLVNAQSLVDVHFATQTRSSQIGLPAVLQSPSTTQAEHTPSLPQTGNAGFLQSVDPAHLGAHVPATQRGFAGSAQSASLRHAIQVPAT